MKVILLEAVKGLGKPDDIVDVSDGYARNYLLKRKLALEATPKNLNTVKTRRAAEKVRQERALAQAQKTRGDLDGKTITIPIKCGQGGKLYGSLTSMDIAAALEAQGYEVDRRGITILEPVKTLGLYDVDIRLHADVSAKIKIELIAKE